PNARRDGFEETQEWLDIKIHLIESICEPLASDAYEASRQPCRARRRACGTPWLWRSRRVPEVTTGSSAGLAPIRCAGEHGPGPGREASERERGAGHRRRPRGRDRTRRCDVNLLDDLRNIDLPRGGRCDPHHPPDGAREAYRGLVLANLTRDYA